jgi:hypothetical protein
MTPSQDIQIQEQRVGVIRSGVLLGIAINNIRKMKTKEQRINEIESSPEYNNWRYDRNKLRDLLDAVWREGMTNAAEICEPEPVNGPYFKRLVTTKRDAAQPNAAGSATPDK